jgi:NADP-dependent 3-hydroxy acid dehydrogenase YdfG
MIGAFIRGTGKMSYFEGKIAVVTGAGSGIGRALAQALNAAGCALELSDINLDTLEKTTQAFTRKDLDWKLERIDVSDRLAMEQWAANIGARRGHVDIVINNAGVAMGGTAEENSIEDVEWLMGINFWGVIYGCKAFLPLLHESAGGHLVNISSVFGIIGVPTQSAYNAAKFAVRGYTEALRQEQNLTESGLHVCCVHPGGVTTNIARSARSFGNDEEHSQFADRFEEMTRTTPASAADQILRAVQRRKPRLLIGRDAKFITLISRLFPASYPRFLALLGGRDIQELVVSERSDAAK